MGATGLRSVNFAIAAKDDAHGCPFEICAGKETWLEEILVCSAEMLDNKSRDETMARV